MIDERGYRPNVGIVLCNNRGQVFWARRCGRDGWQFPQGGIRAHESPEQAMFRELQEEVGLQSQHVEILGCTHDWLHYDIPGEYIRRSGPFRGQKQMWFLLRLVGRDQDVRLDTSAKPEFDAWRWIDYWGALEQIIAFKREVYQQALTELEPLLPERRTP